MASATLAFLGLSAADLAAPEPASWTPEALEVALRRLRALGGAQIRLHAGDPIPGGGKNVVLCGRERSIGGGELLVDHAEWQVSHLYVIDGGDLFDRALADLLAIDFAGLAPGTTAGDGHAATAEGWPISQELELVSADGAAVRVGVPDVRRDEPLAAAVRSLMTAVDRAVRGAEPFRSRGPRIEAEIAACFQEAVRRALLATLRDRSDRWFIAALAAAARGDHSALERLSGRWPATNSGIELAQGDAALFLLGAAPRHLDRFPWHRAPGQPGSRLRRLVSLAICRAWGSDD